MTTNDIPIGWTTSERVTPNEKLKQGDLIYFSKEEDELKTLGLVVTADCDLQRNKHGKLITLVPIVRLKTLMERYLFIEECDKKQQIILEFLNRELKTTAKIDDALSMEILRTLIEEKVESSTPDTILILASKFIFNEVDSLSSDDFEKLMSRLGIKAADQSKKFDSQVKAKGDLIILPSLLTLGFDQDIAWVRQIWQVPIRNITLRNSEANKIAGQRIARLESPYRYRVTQVMAQVFSDIGMPDLDRDYVEDFKKAFK